MTNQWIRTSVGIVATLSIVVTTAVAAPPTTTVSPDDPGFKFVVGYLDKSIPESSGIVASRRHPGVFWTHNDSGNKPQVFAVDRTGKLLATYDVAARNVDWEDIAIDDAGHLYIADVGNNIRDRKRTPVVYRIDEPDPAQKPAGALKPNALYGFRYAGDPFDCESLFIWKDHGYVISKQRDMGNARMFRFPLDAKATLPPVLELVTEIPLRAPVTAANLSADGRELVVLTVFGPYRFIINGDPVQAGKVMPTHVMFLQPDMEAATLVPEGVLVTAESGHVLLFKNESFADPKAGRSALPVTRLNLARATKPITIDGQLTDWDDATTRQTVLADPANALPTTASIWSAWNPSGLFVAARVPRAEPKPLAGQWFTGDAIEIYVGGESDGRSPDYADGDDRCYAGFAATKDGQRGEVVLRWPRRSSPPEGASIAGGLDGDGTYTIEAFLPANAFGSQKPLSPNDLLRFNVSILTGEPRCNWFLSESNTAGTWMSPLKWAVATLR